MAKFKKSFNCSPRGVGGMWCFYSASYGLQNGEGDYVEERIFPEQMVGSRGELIPEVRENLI